MASRRARQQRDRIRQIGVLSPFSENDSETKTRLTAFKDRLNSLVGLTAAMSGSNTGSQRENIERTRDAAVELVALGSDAIVAYANPAVSLPMYDARRDQPDPADAADVILDRN